MPAVVRFEWNFPTVWAGVLTVGLASGTVPGVAEATERYAAQTGVSCPQCHESDMRLTPFGKAFVANGFKLPKNPSPPADDSGAPASGATPPK